MHVRRFQIFTKKMESDSSSSSSNESAPAPAEGQQSRKRLRCFEQWARNKRKTSEKSYKTCSGEHRSPKQPSVSHSCRCQHHCSSRVTMEERTRIFYKLADHDTQNKYLFGLIECTSPKQCRLHASSGKQQRNTFSYFIRLSDEDQMEVCKQAFSKIDAIGKRRVEVL